MKTYEWVICIIVLLIGLVVVDTRAQNVALTPSILNIPSGAVSANCPAPVAGTTIYCWAYDKLEVAPAGGAYVVIWPAGGVAAPVALTINNTTKTLPASFTIAIAATASEKAPKVTAK